MSPARYPIHGEPGCAWFLVSDAGSGGWAVEEIRADAARKRTLIALTDFERSATGLQLAAKVRDAIAKAAGA